MAPLPAVLGNEGRFGRRVADRSCGAYKFILNSYLEKCDKRGLANWSPADLRRHCRVIQDDLRNAGTDYAGESNDLFTPLRQVPGSRTAGSTKPMNFASA